MATTPRLLAAGRALAGLSQAELAAAAGVSLKVVQRFESGSADPRLSSLQAMEDALRARSIEFVAPTDRHLGGVLLVPAPL